MFGNDDNFQDTYIMAAFEGTHPFVGLNEGVRKGAVQAAIKQPSYEALQSIFSIR